MNKRNITMLLLIGSLIAQSVTAKSFNPFGKSKKPNKQRIYISNEFGDKVSVSLEFKGKNWNDFLRTITEELRDEDSNVEIVAPFAGYKLFKIRATPVINNVADLLQDDLLIAAQTKRSINVNHEPLGSNEDVLDHKRIGNHTYFVVQASHKDSAVPGQKKIIIKSFASEQDCEKYKNNSAAPAQFGSVQEMSASTKPSYVQPASAQPAYSRQQPVYTPLAAQSAFDQKKQQDSILKQNQDKEREQQEQQLQNLQRLQDVVAPDEMPGDNDMNNDNQEYRLFVPKDSIFDNSDNHELDDL